MLKSKVHRVHRYRVLVLTLMALLVLIACTFSAPAAFIGGTSIPTSGSFPVGIVAGPDGALWFTESGTNIIGRITTGTTQTITEYCIPTGLQVTPTQSCPKITSEPWSITAGAAGSNTLWFTELAGNKIDSITTNGTTTQTITPYPSYSTAPYGIAVYPDGNIWYTEAGGHEIVRQNPAGGLPVNSGLPPASAPHGIVVGPDGNLWFTESGSNVIGVITTVFAVYQYCIPTGLQVTPAQPCQTTPNRAPEQITAGPDGNLWFTEPGANRIGRLIPTGSSPLSPPMTVSFSEYCFKTTTNPTPWGITAGPDRYLWFTEAIGNRIGRINPTERIGPPAQHIGEIHEFDIGTSSSEPHGITAGPDGNLWLTEYGAGQIGHNSTEVPPGFPGVVVSSGTC
jgi:streptogramin lyase